MIAYEFLDLEEVLEVHALQLDEFGGIAGIRDRGLLESAVEQPRATAFGELLHADLFEMAAATLLVRDLPESWRRNASPSDRTHSRRNSTAPPQKPTNAAARLNLRVVLSLHTFDERSSRAQGVKFVE